MNPHLRRLLLGGGSTPPAPTGDTYSRVVAYCDAPNTGFDTTSRFINLFNHSNQNWGSATPSGGFPITISNSYITNMANGDTISCTLIRLSPARTTQTVKPGSYVLKWSGSALKVAVTGAGVSNQSPASSVATNRVTFDLAQITASDPWDLNLAFTNATGGLASITATPGTRGSLVCCHSTHEALWDAGEIWNPDYVTFLGTNVSYYRSAKGSAVEHSQVKTDTTAVLNEGNLFWGANTDGNGFPTTTGIPASAVAKLCAKLGCDYLCNIPVGASDAVMAVIAAQVAGVSSFAGNVFPEVGNENWNSSYAAPDYPTHITAGSWLANYAVTHSLANAPEAEAHVAMRAAKAFKTAGIASSRVKLSIAFQTAQGWGSVGGGGYADYSFHLVDTANLMGQGSTKKFYELCDQVFCAAYSTPNNGLYLGTPSPDSGDLYHGNIQIIDWKTRTDADLDFYFDNGTTETVVWMNNAVTYLTALRPALASTLASYEMGEQYAGGAQNFGDLRYTINTSTNTGVWDASRLGNPSNGDVIRFYTTAPFTTWVLQDYYIRVVDANNFRVYATGVGVGSATDTYANDAAAKAASIVLNDTSGGPYDLANWTRVLDSYDRISTYLDSTAGRALWQRMYAAYIGTGKFRAWCQSVDLAGYFRSATQAQTAGLKSSLYAPDTTRSTWFTRSI